MPVKGLGDGIIFTGLFNKLNKNGYSIYIISKKENTFFYRINKDISGVIEYDLAVGITRKNIIDQISSNEFDIIVDLHGPGLSPIVQDFYFLGAMSVLKVSIK